MLELILTGLCASAAGPLLYQRFKSRFGWIAVTFPLYLFIRFLGRYREIADGGIIRESTSWIPELGINLSFVLDGLSLTFVLIITLIGMAVFLYAGAYMKEYAHAGRFYLYIGLFMTAMLGLVLADNMIALFLFWELTSVTSYLLIGFNHHREGARKAALQALLVTGGGGLALMAGMILLARITGSLEISALYDLRSQIIAAPAYPAVALLFLLGALTKSAQFPFHFWLPNAMEAPTPVSAYLHSATMVKAGIYLIARFNHILGGTALWQDTILAAGAITMVAAALLSWKQSDLKKLLAYSTLCVLGTLTLLLGIGSRLAIKAFFIYLVAHSLYKGTLFLVAGTLDHETGTRDVARLGGLKRLMPVSAVTAALASFSMMGIIPLVGFIGKETVYSAILEVETWGPWLLAAAVAANALVVMVTLLVGFRPFWGGRKETLKNPHEAPLKMLIGPALLAVLGLLIGLFPDFFIGSLLDRSALSILTEELGLRIKLWHGFNLVLVLSLVTLLLGLGLYRIRTGRAVAALSWRMADALKPSVWYEAGLNGMLRLAGWQTRLLQNGSLRRYLLFILVTAVGTAGFALLRAQGVAMRLPEFTITFYEAVLAAIIIIASVMVITSSSRLKAVVAIGVVGFCMGIIFILYSAPDLALTTFAIETLTVILFVLVLYRLPRFVDFSPPSRRLRDALVAAAVGLFMTAMVLTVTAGELVSELKSYFAANSLPGGKGRNIVNVILVDFRAIDTLGEISVLAVAAIGVFALLKLRPDKGEQ